jgi:hypothetical protein
MPIQTNRNDIERQLRSYGEDAIASKAAGLTESDLVRIGERAFDYACMPTTKKSGGGMMIAKAIAHAAVEIIEGSPRELRRKKRVIA